MRETKAGGLGLAASKVTERSLAWEDDEGDDREGDFGAEVEGCDGEGGERTAIVREPIRLLSDINRWVQANTNRPDGARCCACHQGP